MIKRHPAPDLALFQGYGCIRLAQMSRCNGEDFRFASMPRRSLVDKPGQQIPPLADSDRGAGVLRIIVESRAKRRCVLHLIGNAVVTVDEVEKLRIARIAPRFFERPAREGIFQKIVRHGVILHQRNQFSPHA
ncbi:hypothetical protein D3C80_1515580 [compost metagenome]